MSYIRFGERLSSGKASDCYIYGDNRGINNVGEDTYLTS